jgi:uncharacterized repeat protein (TIGR02543 family)
MHNVRRIGHALRNVVIIGLVVSACQDQQLDPERADLARNKDRQMTITGAGTGSGKVTVPQVFEVAPATCAIINSESDAPSCTRKHPYRSKVVVTATPDSGSTFAGWKGACTGTSPTCELVMTQARTVTAQFDGTAPPSFTLTIVGAGNGSGNITSQPELSPPINCTITLGNALDGTCSASYVSGTTVTLTPAAVAGHTFAGWSGSCSGTGPCTLVVSSTMKTTATFTSAPPSWQVGGRWEPPRPMPIVGVHATRLRGGLLLLWGLKGEPFTMNADNLTFSEIPNNTCTDPTTCELFCSGHTFLADGKLLVAGGHITALGNGYGLKQTSIFDGTTWKHTGSMNYARWYPTLVTLADGRVVAVSGTQEPALKASYPERYENGTWTVLTTAFFNMGYYPRMFVEPKNGWVFLAGEINPRYLNPNGTGSWTTTGLGAGKERNEKDRDYGPAVMLDSKVLYLGGGGATCPILPKNTTEMIDLNNPTAGWVAKAPMAFRRRQHNATILPDGTVLVTGGTSWCGFNNENGAVYTAELYDPATDRWATLGNASIPRGYHSTTVLHADGRVFSMGNGDGGNASQQTNFEIFWPPYLYKGARPTYTMSASQVRYGQPFTVVTPNAAAIRKVTIIRHMSTTHSWDEGGRLNTLNFQVTPDGTGLTITPPASGLIAPPGPYMLFLLNQAGVPSRAKTIVLQ